MTSDLSTLMHQELELAKAEVKQTATRAGAGAGMLVGAAIGALLVLIFLSTAAWWSIGNSTGRGWSALIVAGIWALIAAVLFVVGRSQLPKARGIPRTTETVKKFPTHSKATKETRTDDQPDQIRADVARTRAELSDKVNTLSYEANPKTIARRQFGKVRLAFTGAKDKVMGGADNLTSSSGSAESSAGQSIGAAASSVGDAISDAPTRSGRRPRATHWPPDSSPSVSVRSSPACFPPADRSSRSPAGSRTPPSR